MFRYMLRRVLLIIPVMIGVSFLVFFIMDLAPGDFVDGQIAQENLTIEEETLLRKKYDADGTLIIRYGRYLGGLFHGDFGKSYITGEPVLEVYIRKLPATLALAGASVLAALLIALPLGILAAAKHGTVIDSICMALGVLGLSIPDFWLGMMLILVIALNVSWIPTSGFHGVSSIILPALTIGTGLAAGLSRMTRTSMLDVLGQNYLTTHRAMGSSEFRLMIRYALPNALIPVLTVAGGQLAACLGGSVLTETIFAWPGVGRLIVDSVHARDIPMVVGCIILKSFNISLVLLITDLLYALVDPRIRTIYAGGRVKGT